MALQKIKNLRTGFAIQYWEIISITIDFQKGYARAVLAGYKDEAIYTADKGAYVETYPFEFQVTHELVEQENILQYAYAKLQESIPSEHVVEPAKEEIVNEKGEVLELAKEAETVTVEQNFFADAVKL
jgi:hypothetical protein